MHGSTLSVYVYLFFGVAVVRLFVSIWWLPHPNTGCPDGTFVLVTITVLVGRLFVVNTGL